MFYRKLSNFTSSILKKPMSKKAFSLIELSVVILVVSVATAAYISTSTTKLATEKVGNFDEKAHVIYKAMGRYLASNKKLPCPASLKEKRDSSSSYGAEATAADCVSAGVYQSSTAVNLIVGMVPVQTLGLSRDYAEDAYGNKLMYFVDKRLTRTNVDLNSFEDHIISNDNLLQLAWSQGNGVTFIIMGRGANGGGAFGVNSSTPSADSIQDEGSNDIRITNDVSLPPIGSYDNWIYTVSGPNQVFDDRTFYKKRDDLLNDFNQWSLVPCAAGAAETLYCGTNFTWPKAYAGQSVASNEDCPSSWNSPQARPTKKCGKKGVWGAVDKPCTSADPAAEACYEGYCQRTATYYGSGSQDGPNSQWYPSGTVVTLGCRSGNARAPGGSGTVDTSCSINGPFTMGSNRRMPAPTITCNSNGTWTLANDCTGCASCSAWTGVEPMDTSIISESMSCNNHSMNSSSIISACRTTNPSWYLNNGEWATVGYYKRRRCNTPCRDRNICLATRVWCVDGYLYAWKTYGGVTFSHDLGGQDWCNHDGNGYVNCGGHSQSCG